MVFGRIEAEWLAHRHRRAVLRDLRTTDNPSAPYDQIGRPVPVDLGARRRKGLARAGRAMLCGLMVREGRFDRELVRDILTDAATGGEELPFLAHYEECWIVYSQRQWPLLRAHVLRALTRPDADRRIAPFLSDLAFLSFYRSETGRIQAGTDEAGFAEAARCELGARERDPGMTTDRLAVYRGVCDFARKIEEGWTALTRARTIAPRLATVLRACESVFSDEFVDGRSADALRYLDAFSTRSIRLPERRDGAEPVFLVSLDAAYFASYAAAFLRNLSAVNPNGTVHFHCVGFEPSRDVLDRGRASGLAIGVTVDRVSLKKTSQNFRKGYYAGARYLYLVDYLDRFERIVVADVDAVATDGISRLFGKKDAVGLSTWELGGTRRLRRAPWETFQAGHCTIDRSDANRDFARHLKTYLATALQQTLAEDREFFCSDQTALYAAYRRSEALVSFHRLEQLFEHPKDWRMFHGEQSKIDTVTRHR